MNRIPATFDAIILRAAETWLPDWDWRLLKAQFYQESLLDPTAKSSAGAMGLAQFMPGTWQDMIRELRLIPSASPYDPEQAVHAGAYYMAKLIGTWRAERPEMDRYCLALASYNAGIGNVLEAQRAAGGKNAYADIIAGLPHVTGTRSHETVTYVRRILAYWAQLITAGE